MLHVFVRFDFNFIHILDPNWSNGEGKCNHGGLLDSYATMPPSGGINKESSDPSLSPHHHLHEDAGKAALSATVQFLVGAGNSLVTYKWTFSKNSCSLVYSVNKNPRKLGVFP